MTLSERLRHATRDAHVAAEAAVTFMRPPSESRRFFDALSILVSMHERHETLTRTEADASDVAFHEARRKASAGRRAMRHQSRALEPVAAADLLPAGTVAATVGRVYVIEGSTHGGKLINRWMDHTLGITDAAACAFFDPYGRRHLEMWSDTRDWIDAAPVAIHDDVAAAARATFAAFETALSSLQRR